MDKTIYFCNVFRIMYGLQLQYGHGRPDLLTGGAGIISMKHMIIAAVMLLTLIPAIVTGYLVNHYAQAIMKDNKLDSLANVVHMMDVHLSRFMDHIISDIQLKAENEILKRALLAAEGPAGLDSGEYKAVQKLVMEYIGFPVEGGALITADGEMVVSSRSGEAGMIVDQTEYFRTIMAGKESYIGMMAIDEQNERIMIAVPIHDDEGRTIGILRQSINPEPLNHYMGSLNLGESGHVFLLCKDGSMVTDQEVGNPVMVYHEYQNSSSLEQIITAFRTGRLMEENGIIEFKLNSWDYIGAFSKVDTIGCIAVVSIKKSELFGALSELKIVLVTAVLLLLSYLMIVFIFIRRIHNELLNIGIDTLKKIGNGDLTARCRYSGYSVFDTLSRNINSLADSYQKSEKELRMSYRVDSLTRLPNRDAIYELLDTILYKHPNQALLLIELIGFKNANENLGYDIGDRILMEAGDILRELPQHVCYPSRLGGAEFLVFVTNWTAFRYPEKIAERIIKKVEGIRFIDELHVDIGASIGIVYAESERIDKKKLIKHCNAAVYKAKTIGKNAYYVYYPNMQKKI